MRRVFLIALLSLTVFATARAQAGGQLCVRAFEDRNANGVLDAGEPLLTAGISVNLLNAQNVTIASALLDQSPTAAQGVVCFQNLPAGQYTLDLSSADLKPTTPASITTTIADGGLPTVVEFGGQRPMVPTPASSASTAGLDRNQIVRIVVSVLGTLVVIAGMAFLGTIVYLIAFRPSPAPIADPRRTTGSIAAVTADKRRTTGSIPAVTPDKRRTTGSTPIVRTEDARRTPPGGQPAVPRSDERDPF